MERILQNKPEWIRPKLEGERGEVERVIASFLGREVSEEEISRVEKILEDSPVVELSDEDWAVLENTDSYHEVSPGRLSDAEKITEHYNAELLPENKRDFGKLVQGFQSSNRMECPTILKHGERMHLISGNTRLMISRALGIRPKVIVGLYD